MLPFWLRESGLLVYSLFWPEYPIKFSLNLCLSLTSLIGFWLNVVGLRISSLFSAFLEIIREGAGQSEVASQLLSDPEQDIAERRVSTVASLLMGNKQCA